MPDVRLSWLALPGQWWQGHHWLALLSSANPHEREQACAWFADEGARAKPLLRRALRGGYALACGAAIALVQQGDRTGMHTVLRRCCEEEWLLYHMHFDASLATRALQRLPPEALYIEMHQALAQAALSGEVSASLPPLTHALSALRVLALFPEPIAASWCAEGLHFGHCSLAGLSEKATRSLLAHNLTDMIRQEAAALFLRHPHEETYSVFAAALHSDDISVGKTAVWGLQQLGDPRALALLQPIAFVYGHPLAARAREAIECIAGAGAEMLTLLRASEPEYAPESLLRPATPAKAERETQQLVRPIGEYQERPS